MLRPSPNHGTQRLPNDDDDDDVSLGVTSIVCSLPFVYVCRCMPTRVYILYIYILVNKVNVSGSLWHILETGCEDCLSVLSSLSIFV